MNLVDTTAYRGKRFEIKKKTKKLRFLIRSFQTKHLFLIFGPDSCSQSFSFQWIHKT